MCPALLYNILSKLWSHGLFSILSRSALQRAISLWYRFTSIPRRHLVRYERLHAIVPTLTAFGLLQAFRLFVEILIVIGVIAAVLISPLISLLGVDNYILLSAGELVLLFSIVWMADFYTTVAMKRTILYSSSELRRLDRRKTKILRNKVIWSHFQLFALIGTNCILDVLAIVDFLTVGAFSTNLIVAHGCISLEILAIIRSGIKSANGIELDCSQFSS